MQSWRVKSAQYPLKEINALDVTGKVNLVPFLSKGLKMSKAVIKTKQWLNLICKFLCFAKFILKDDVKVIFSETSVFQALTSLESVTDLG